MSGTRITRSLNELKRGEEGRSPLGVLSEHEFRRVVDHERARSDRSGHVFSLLIIEIASLDGEKNGMRDVVNVLSHRLRSVDEVGLLEGANLGLVLPLTPGRGARNLASDIRQLHNSGEEVLTFRVYTYPSEWFSDNNNTSGDWPLQRRKSKKTASSSSDSDIDQTTRLEKTTEDLDRVLLDRMPGWKRTIDVLGSLLGLILSLPFFLVIPLTIKVVSSGPVIFKQQRIGYLGRVFSCWKFRTMKVDADQNLHQQHLTRLIENNKPMKKLDLSHDPRLIPLGKMFRQIGLDELPQLINIIRGEMSLVGPRPDVPYAVTKYTQWHKRRFDTHPGLTGLWQVNGKNELTLDEMMRLDIDYISNMSLWLDIKILLKTMRVVSTLVWKTLSPNRIFTKTR